MSANATLAALFEEMAALLEITGANAFRVNAHARVARALESLDTDVASIAKEPGELESVEGIGEGSAKRIREWLETGSIKDLEKLRGEVPPGLPEVLAVPGLGPKTVRAMWKDAGVVDLASLKAKLADGSLLELPRMGEKTLARIRESLEFMEKSGGRVRLGEAAPIAAELQLWLLETKGVERVEIAGSLRRGRETIGDMDLLACGSDAAALVEAFRSHPEVKSVLLAGDTKCSVRLSTGMQADLRVVDASCFGAAWLYFTGSKEHNVRLRERAIARKMRLNEYGLFPDDGNDAPPQTRGVKPVAAKTEESIYQALDLPWIPPELREDHGELDLKKTPVLVTVADIRSELHAHTRASDGAMTIEEIATIAKDRGFHTLAITDHSKSSVQANGLDAKRLRKHIEAIREAEAKVGGIRLLAGSEVDILADGRLDYDDDLLAELDWVVASPHVALRQEPKVATERLLAAVRHPLVHVLGHPTGRLIGSRPGLEPDLEAVAKAAAECGTALEVNANHYRLDLRDRHVRLALEAGCWIAIDCDVHTPEQFDELPYGVMTARRGGLTPDRCLNCLDAKALEKWRKKKRPKV
ncbi:MAG: DNA polymerase/3'-5' exonuclease PolX [Phycisphaerales bacterium]